MRLCFVGWGDHVHVERWAGYFAERGHDVAVISVSGLGKYPAGVRQYALGLERRGDRWKILKLRYLLAKIGPELVHVHWAPFSSLAARASALPLVVTAWGSDIYRLPMDHELERSLQAARLITCDSIDQKERLRRISGVAEENIHVIQWGVDASQFNPAAPDPGLAAELGVLGRQVVLSARQLTPLYNHETVVSAFALVRRQIPDAVLVLKQYIAKDPQYVRDLQGRIDALGLRESVRMVGMLPYARMAGIYRLAPVTVSVPFSDGTSMSVLEAMACASVPIVSDLPSLREWIRDGWNGYLVPPRDAEAIAARLVSLLTNAELRSLYAARNLEIVRERATQQANMARMEELYQDIQRRPATSLRRKAVA